MCTACLKLWVGKWGMTTATETGLNRKVNLSLSSWDQLQPTGQRSGEEERMLGDGQILE